jgi:mono/diheme cytochrome c family protein
VRTILPSAALAFVLAVVCAGSAGLAQGTLGTAASSGDAGQSSSDAALVKTYCAGCHNDRTRSGELSLEHADLTNIPQHPELWEKVIRKVRAGMMPPAGMPRPDAATFEAFVSRLETSIDRAAAASPRPGRTALHRLNRAEYANAIRDLLSLEIDATALLPPDDESSGFDNIADVLTVSPC